MPLIAWGVLIVAGLAAGGYAAEGVSDAAKNTSSAATSLTTLALVCAGLYVAYSAVKR